jgi:hypothetical protein
MASDSVSAICLQRLFADGTDASFPDTRHGVGYHPEMDRTGYIIIQSGDAMAKSHINLDANLGIQTVSIVFL